MKNRMDDVYIKMLPAILAFIVVIGACTILFGSGAVRPFVSCYAVDSQGRIYVGEGEEIAIYENQEKVGSINVRTSRGYSFIIQNDVFLLSKGNYIYRLDFKKQTDPVVRADVDLWEQLERTYDLQKRISFGEKKYSTPNGDTYELRSLMFWTNIRMNDDVTVYQITAFSFVVKLILYISCLSFAVYFCVILKKARDEEGWYESRFKWGERSRGGDSFRERKTSRDRERF